MRLHPVVCDVGVNPALATDREKRTDECTTRWLIVTTGERCACRADITQLIPKSSWKGIERFQDLIIAELTSFRFWVSQDDANGTLDDLGCYVVRSAPPSVVRHEMGRVRKADRCSILTADA